MKSPQVNIWQGEDAFSLILYLYQGLFNDVGLCTI